MTIVKSAKPGVTLPSPDAKKREWNKFFVRQIVQIAGHFEDELRLRRLKLRKDSPSPKPNCAELIYKNQSMPDVLAIYIYLHYRKNALSHPYPSDLIVASDYSDGRLQDVIEAFKTANRMSKAFLFYAQDLNEPNKREKFDMAARLKVGSGIIELAEIFDQVITNQ